MKSKFGQQYGGEGRVADYNSPEVKFLQALAGGDEEGVLALFEEEKQFGGISAVDTAHGRYEGLEAIRRCVQEWYGAFEAIDGEVEICTQIHAGMRAALEFCFILNMKDGSVLEIPMALAADIRGRRQKLDEVRMYVHCMWLPSYPKYRVPIFPPTKTLELHTEMASGVMPHYFKLVMEEGMINIPDLMTDEEEILMGAYGAEDTIYKTTRKELLRQRDEAVANGAKGDPIGAIVGLRMEHFIDDGHICCVEWEQTVTRRGRAERNRLSEPGISFYERAADGRLKSFRIIDYAYTEQYIDWDKAPITKEEAEKINYEGADD